jgi:hypothetical protein
MLGGLYELDRFHLKGALHRGLDSDALAAEVCQACIIGGIDKVDKLLTGAQEKADGDTAKEVMKAEGKHSHFWERAKPVSIWFHRWNYGTHWF